MVRPCHQSLAGVVCNRPGDVLGHGPSQPGDQRPPQGIGGVLVCGCHLAESHYIEGNKKADISSHAAALKVEELLLTLKERYTIIAVSHSLSQARRLADEALIFRDGPWCNS